MEANPLRKPEERAPDQKEPEQKLPEQKHPERRTTRQRETILQIVRRAHSHPDAEEVYRLARRKLPAISLGTVYRNLKLLAESGEIREVQFLGGPARFDGMLAAHEHFCCTECGQIQDLEATLSDADLTKMNRTIRGIVKEYKLDYFGICSACVSKNDGSEVAAKSNSTVQEPTAQ